MKFQRNGFPRSFNAAIKIRLWPGRAGLWYLPGFRHDFIFKSSGWSMAGIGRKKFSVRSDRQFREMKFSFLFDIKVAKIEVHSMVHVH